MRISTTFKAGRTVAVLTAISAAAAGLLDSAPAAAQYTTPVVTKRPVGQQAKQQADVSARDASVLRRPRADAPDGLPIGNFVLFPKIELDGEYDDNVFRTRNNTEGDFVFRVRPSFSLASDWAMHAVELYGLLEIARYTEFTREDYEAFSVGGRVRIDINDDLAWLTDADVSRSRLPRGAPGLIGTPIGVSTILYTYTVGTQILYNGDPIYGRIGPRFRRVDYVKGVSNDENFNLWDIQGRIGYRVSPDFSVFLDAGYQWVRYDQRLDLAGFERDSEGFDVRLGVAYDVARTITAELGVGYYRRTYNDGRLKPEDGLSVLGRLFWNPTDTISVEAEARRSMSEYRTTINNAAAVGSAIETYVGLRVAWEPIEPLVIDAGGAFANYKYRVGGTSEDYWYFDIGARYFFTKNFYAGPRYYLEHRNAKPSVLNYTDNRFLLTLGAQL